MQQNFKMLPQRNGLSLQSPLRPLSVLVFHLLLTHSVTVQSHLIGPSQPIVATVGDGIILPCHLEPAVDVAAMTLVWTRSDLDPEFVYVRRFGQDLVHTKHPSYKGRTSLFTDELKRGNISLKLSDVRPSDAGRYKCYIPDMLTGSFIELLVGAASSPVISLAGIDNEGVVLQCESAGWYPEPEVLWLDGEGKLLSAGPTETVRGPDYLYTVSSRVTVEKRHNNSFTCRVQQRNINQTRETHVQVPDDFFKVQSSSPVITGLAVSLAVYIMFIALLLVLLRKRRQNIIKTTRRYRYVIEKGQKKKSSQTNKTEDQSVPIEEREHLMRTGTVQMKASKGKGGKKSKHIKKQRSQQQEEAEKGVQTLKEELETKKKEVETKQCELQQLHEEKQRNEDELQTLKEKLENKNKEGQNKDDQQRKEVETLKKQLETQQMELDSNIKKIDEKQAEVQQLQNEMIQRMESNLQTVMETLSKNIEPKTNESVPGQLGVSSRTRHVIVPGINKYGKYIRLRNTSSQEQQLKNWEIHVQFNNTKPIIYKFDDSLRLKSGETVRMWPPGHHKLYGSSPNNLEWRNLKTWSSTDQLQIKLISSTGETKHYR